MNELLLFISERIRISAEKDFRILLSTRLDILVSVRATEVDNNIRQFWKSIENY